MPDGPLSGVRVLLTRPRADAAALAARLERLGADVVPAPLIAIRPPEDASPLDDALRTIARYDWLAFTSANAVRAVAVRLTALGIAVPDAVQMAVVGPATARALEAAGLRVDRVAPAGTAAGLVEMMGPEMSGRRVLLPQGDRARTELAEGLHRAGARVETVVAYRTVAEDGPPPIHPGDIVALFSPSAAERVAALAVEAARHAKIVCIGPTTASAARGLGLEPAVVAPDRTEDGMVGAILVAAGRGA